MSYTTNAVEELLLVEVVVYDPNLGATRTLYFSTGTGHTTGPAETPPNTTFEPRIKQAVDIRRTMFAPRTTRGRSTVGLGAVVLLNGDAALEAFADYGVDGRAITIRRGPAGAAYPGGFTTVFVGTMANVEVTQDEVRLLLRDNQVLLNVPLQTTKYAGTNALPNGLEGVADDLLGKPKPVLYGTVLNIAPPCVNTSKLIYQVNDGAVSEVTQVYDAGIPLTNGIITWTSRSSAASFNSVKFRNGRFVAVGGTDGVSSAIYTSDDGETWTSRTTSFGTSEVKDVDYGAGVWVAVGYSGKIASSSDNGETWTQRTSAAFGTDLIKGVAFGNDVFVITGGAASSLVETSPDGTTWTSRTSALSGAGGLVAFGAGVFVMSGVTGQVASSPDGITWTGPHATSTAIFGASQVLRPGFGRDRFVVGDSDGNAATSLDGTSWTEAPNTGFSTTSIWAAAHGFGVYVIVGASSKLAVSSDGVAWVLQLTGVGGTIFGAAFGTNTLVLCGTFGLAQSSGRFAYASEADLLDDAQAPEAGTYGYYAAGGLLRIGAAPVGRITANVTQGAAASNRYVGQLFTAVLTRAGMSASDWNATDVTDIDTAAPYVLGFWQGPEETTCSAVLDLVAGSVGAAWFTDLSGDFRIKQLVAPTGTPALTLADSDILREGKLTRITSNDPGQGIPAYKTLVRYARNYTVQGTDLSGGVTAARRSVVEREWNEAQATDATVQTAHPQAVQSVDDSLLTIVANAQSEATRRQSLRGAARGFFEFTVALDDDTAALELNDVIEVVHSRYALGIVGSTTDGTLLRVLGLAIDGEQRELTITTWGGPDDSMANRITQDDYPTYRVTSDGAYRVTQAA